MAFLHKHHLVGGESPRVDGVPRPEVLAMSGSDTELNGEAEGSDAEGVIIEAIRLGRVVGIVVGNIIRRLVAKAEKATLPVHVVDYSWCECVAHILQSLTNVDPEATVISIDGVGAYDLQEHNDDMADGDQIPFCAVFPRHPINMSVGG